MMRTSVRLRLTLWNISVLALILLGFTVTVKSTVERNVLASVDRDLAREADRSATRYADRSAMRRLSSSDPLTPFGDRANFARLISQLGGLEQLRRQVRPRWEARRDDPHPVRLLDPSGHTLLPLFPWAFRPQVTGPIKGTGGETPTRAVMRGLLLSGDIVGDSPWDPGTFHRSLAGATCYSTIRVNSNSLRVFSAPLRVDGQTVGVVQVAHPLSDLTLLLGGLRRTLLMLAPLSILAAGLAGAFLTGRALRPVREITRAAGELNAEDLSRRLPVTGGDEFARLAATFNGMIGRLEEAFTQMERAFDHQRRFTADASHELRTPLTAIKANTSLALQPESTLEECREALAAADSAADRMNRTIRDLLLLARSDSGTQELALVPISVVKTLQDAVELASAAPGQARICLEADDSTLQIVADSHHLVRLFLNLLENALRHTPENGRVTLRAHGMGDLIVMTVTDTGEGIPPEHLAHVCERFYRVDAARTRGIGGTGLGLAICRSIAAAHGGSLTIHSVLGQGTTVNVTLPRFQASRPQPLP